MVESEVREMLRNTTPKAMKQKFFYMDNPRKKKRGIEPNPKRLRCTKQKTSRGDREL